MTAHAIYPTSPSSTASYRPHTRHDDGVWSMKVDSGIYEPPEGWTIHNIVQLSTGCLVRIQREGGDD